MASYCPHLHLFDDIFQYVVILTTRHLVITAATAQCKYEGEEYKQTCTSRQIVRTDP